MDVVLMGDVAKKKGRCSKEKGRCRLRIGPCVDLWLFLNREGDRSARQLPTVFLHNVYPSKSSRYPPRPALHCHAILTSSRDQLHSIPSNQTVSIHLPPRQNLHHLCQSANSDLKSDLFPRCHRR